MVASRTPGRRSASATASQASPVSADWPRGEDGAGAGGHQVGRRPGPEPRDPSRVGERDDQAHGDVVREARLARLVPEPGGQRAAQAARGGEPGGRLRTAAADRAQRGDQVAARGADVLRHQRDHVGGPACPDQPGAVEQGPGQPRVGAGTRRSPGRAR